MTNQAADPRFNYLHPAQIALQKEISQNHPELLASIRGEIIETQLAVIAEYCGIAVDGFFSQKATEDLMYSLLAALKKKSSSIILIH